MSGLISFQSRLACAQQISARDAGETRHVRATGEQPAVDVGKCSAQRGSSRLGVLRLHVHRAEHSAITSCVLADSAVAHLADRFCEQPVADENVGVFRKETEDQPRHEMVHVMPACLGSPIRVVLQQLDIELVEPSGRLDVDRVVLDLA